MVRFFVAVMLCSITSLSLAQIPLCPAEDPHRSVIVSNSGKADYRDLQTAIDAEGCASYYVDANNFTPPKQLLIRDVSLLISSLTEKRIVLDGQSIRRPITIEATAATTTRQQVLLFGLDILNGRASGGGGAISIRGSVDVTIGNASIRQGTADRGGAIAVEDGGALRLAPPPFEHKVVEFIANVAQGAPAEEGGGAIFCTGSALNLTGAVFTGNDATGRGGVLHAENCEAAVSGVTMAGNSATSGAVIYLSGSTLDLHDAEVVDNTALGFPGARSDCPDDPWMPLGGTISAVRSTVTIDRARFDGNAAVSSGPADCVDGFAGPSVSLIAVDESLVRVSNSQFRDNHRPASRAELLFSVAGSPQQPGRLSLSHTTLLHQQVDDADIYGVFGLHGDSESVEHLLIENSIIWYDQPLAPVHFMADSGDVQKAGANPDLDVLEIRCLVTPELETAERRMDLDAVPGISVHVTEDPALLEGTLQLADTSPAIDLCARSEVSGSRDYLGAIRPVDHPRVPGGEHFDAGAMENQNGTPAMSDLSVNFQSPPQPVVAAWPFELSVRVANWGLEAMNAELLLTSRNLFQLTPAGTTPWNCLPAGETTLRCTLERVPGDGSVAVLTFDAQAHFGSGSAQVTAELRSDSGDVNDDNNIRTLHIEVEDRPMYFGPISRGG
ncbi:MAG: hypothetical protein QNJ40_03820 [Xanthomonadales bacterium]|nr:hypothetical protein [Xanthomonadales bacterium]